MAAVEGISLYERLVGAGGLADPHWEPSKDVPQADLWRELIPATGRARRGTGNCTRVARRSHSQSFVPAYGDYPLLSSEPRKVRSKDAPPPAAWLTNCPDGLAIRRLSVPVAIPIRMWARPARLEVEKRILKWRARTPLSKICARNVTPRCGDGDAQANCAQLQQRHDKLRLVDMTYYILRKDGAYAGVSLWEGYDPDHLHKIAVHDGKKRAEKTEFLFKGYSQDFPPQPSSGRDGKRIPIDAEWWKRQPSRRDSRLGCPTAGNNLAISAEPPSPELTSSRWPVHWAVRPRLSSRLKAVLLED